MAEPDIKRLQEMCIETAEAMVVARRGIHQILTVALNTEKQLADMCGDDDYTRVEE